MTENNNNIDIRSNVRVLEFIMYIWGNIKEEHRNIAAQEILEIFRSDENVCNEMLDNYNFTLGKQNEMPTQSTFQHEPKNHTRSNLFSQVTVP